MVKAVYTTEQTINMYCLMQYGPFLKKERMACLTEPYYQAMLDILIPSLQPDMTVLDLGCALGRMTFELAKQGTAQAIGIDTSQEFITACHQIAANQNQCVAYPVPPQAKVSFLLADAQALPFPEHTFQCVLCLNLIDRVAHPSRVIAEITRVLSPAGLLLISDPYEWEEDRTEPTEWIANMRDVFADGEWDILLEQQRDPFTIQVYDRKISTYVNHTLLLRKR